jgi:tRNA (guanine37-N1)-methyltransferase
VRFHIITLFPNSFDSYLGESILKRAIEDKKISVHFYNPRDFVDPENKFKHIDKPPYAGGPGMVIQAMPVIKAVEKALMMAGRFQKLDLRFKNKTKKKESKSHSKILNLKSKILLVWLTPSGKQFDTSYAKKSAKK